jgi:hypothetical protein
LFAIDLIDRSLDRVVQKTDLICHHAAMKKVLIYIPVVLSLVILGAHFMRWGNAIGVFGSLALIALLIVDRGLPD